MTIRMWTVLWTTIRKARNHCQDVDHCRDEDHCQYHLGIDHCQTGNHCRDREHCQNGNEHADDQNQLFLSKQIIKTSVMSYHIILAWEAPLHPSIIFHLRTAAPSVRRISEEFQRIVATKKQH